MSARGLPTGTITFLFTDIEGSTRLAGGLPEDWPRVVEDHDRLLREVIEAHGGTLVRTEGDAVFAAFPDAVAAVHAAVEGQRAVADHPWPQGAGVRVRMGLHTGRGVLGGGDYVGLDVHEAARVAAAGHGGQVVLSGATRALVEQALPPGTVTRDRGRHPLKDLERPTHLFDLEIEGLAADFPPLRVAGVLGNLPEERSSFVGRDREVREVRELIGTARLVTLIGPGGTGKTRLSMRVARELAPGFDRGAWFVDLSPIVDADLVPSAIASALGIRHEGRESLMDVIVAALADREALLILDNFEQVTHAAGMVGGILDGAPGTHVIVTSRTPLHLYGEREYPVAPLSVAEGGSLEEVSASEAGALFLDRARSVDPSFELTDETAPVVRDLCARLDGLPLAIELAASRVRVLSPAAIRDRLSDRFDVLTAKTGDLPERQRTLRATIDWSHALLGDRERTMLAALSVFAGGWSLGSAEVVWDEDGPVIDLLEDLVEHSLVVKEQRGGVPRFWMLESIREYASARLEELGTGHTYRRRHAEHFRALAAEARPHLVGADQGAWVDLLTLEHDNLRAALRWAIEHGEADLAAWLGRDLWRYWQYRGYLDEGRRWMDRVIGMEGFSPEARFWALIALGNLAYWQDDERTGAYWEEALSLARRLGDQALEMEALYNLSYLPMSRSEPTEENLARAADLLDEASRLAAQLEDRRMGASLRKNRAWLSVMRGRPDEAVGYAQEALAMHLEIGDRWEIANEHLTLGQIHRFRADGDRAREHYFEAARLLGEIQELPLATLVLYGLAAVRVLEGDPRRAMLLWGAADAVRREIGISGAFAMQLGDPEAEARRVLGDEEVDLLIAEGGSLTVPEAIELEMTDADG